MENETAVAEAIGAVAEAAPPRAGVRVLRSEDAGRSPARIYRRMRLAAVDLDPERAARLAEEPGVVGVFANQRRRIPGFVAHDAPGAHAHEATPRARDVQDPGAARFADVRAAAEGPAELLDGAGDASARGSAAIPTHSWCLDLVGLPEGYARATGRGIRVAVLDTGIDLAHDDFGGAVRDGHNAASFVPGVASARDGNGHGTHCAGVVAGPRQSSGGRRYGVAPDVELLVGKVLDDLGNGQDEWMLDGIDWARDRGAHVVSLSLGAGRDPGGAIAVPYEVMAGELLALGILVVAAAGNDSARPAYTLPVANPAACPSILSVAAVDRRRRVGYFSCCETPPDEARVDVSAPGVAVYSAWKGGGFRTISGTSMAAPHVAGVAALWAERHGLAGRELWDRLVGTAAALAPSTDFGAGLVQAP